jgi:hypothetical protein
MNAADPIEPADVWCRGCRRAGTRPLTDDERLWIRKLRTHHRRRAAIGALILPVGMPALIWLGLQFSETIGEFISFPALLIGIPVSILMLRDHLRLAGQLSRDLKGGTVRLFEAPEPSEYLADAENEFRAIPFAMLEASGQILGDQKRAPLTPASLLFRSLTVSRPMLTEVPHFEGARMSAPLSLQVVHPAEGAEFRQRPLTEKEAEEIDRVRRSLMRPSLMTILPLSFLGLFVIGFIAKSASASTSTGDRVGSVLVVFLCLAALRKHVRFFVTARQLRRDLRVGVVVIVRDADAPRREFLPASHLVWTFGGVPVSWRDRKAGVERLRRSL